MVLYILKYNNYYNRVAKREENIGNYLSTQNKKYTLPYTNFNPGDGINTTHVFGSNASNYNGDGDYMVVFSEYGQLISRWFIIDATRDRGGQWTLSLRRDVVADYWDSVINADCFIEKATLNNDNPLLFNREDVQVNQILTSQTLLKDETECGWFVGYYAKNAPDISGTVATNEIRAEVYDILDVPIASWTYANYTNDNPFRGPLTKALFLTRYRYPTDNSYFDWEDGYDVISKNKLSRPMSSNTNVTKGSSTTDTYAAKIEEYKGSLLDALSDEYGDHTNDEMVELVNYNNKLILDSTGAYYRLTVVSKGSNQKTYSDLSAIPELKGIMTNAIREAGFGEQDPNNSVFRVEVASQEYYMTYVQESSFETTYNIPSTNKMTTVNEAFNIFAIPYGDVVIKDITNPQSIQTISMSKNIGLQTISSILGSHGGETEAGSRVYDAQLIGYCPVQNLISGQKELTITDSRQASFIKSGDTNVGAIFHVPSASITLDIEFKVDPVDPKVNTQCEMYRLIAPDQSSYFDFDPYKNNGVNYINIDINLKPYNCYIHANPNFKYLYGKDFNTGRGLIFGSNLSLSRAVNSFTEYQIQNSQYQNIFDRQIQNMEVHQKYQRMQDIIGAGMGTMQGAVSGAFTGSVMSPGIGTAIGAAVGGLTSAAGGMADVLINDKLRSEAIDYTRDQFGLNIRNIQAQPNTLSRITALTQNNTIFIAVEYYTCTEEEKEAVAKKIAWNGMTVNAIGKIKDYINNNWSYNNIESKGYIKGRLIRLDDIQEDFHIVKVIAEEINKGVYMK